MLAMPPTDIYYYAESLPQFCQAYVISAGLLAAKRPWSVDAVWLQVAVLPAADEAVRHAAAAEYVRRVPIESLPLS